MEAATIVPLAISTILFFNRVLAKIMGLGGGWGADDVTIAIAWVCITLYMPQILTNTEHRPLQWASLPSMSRVSLVV